MTKRIVVLICLLSLQIHAQRADDFHLRHRATGPQDNVVTADDIRELAKQGATLDGINFRLNAIDDNVKAIRATLDNDVLPATHVMKFLTNCITLLVPGILITAFGIWFTNYLKRSPKRKNA